jgi:hypothetical protein
MPDTPRFYGSLAHILASLFEQFRVTDVHDVTGLIHGPAAGADAFCIYLEFFSFSLLCTIEYTHTVLPNFHIVTFRTFLSVVPGYLVPQPPYSRSKKSSPAQDISARAEHYIETLDGAALLTAVRTTCTCIETLHTDL